MAGGYWPQPWTGEDGGPRRWGCAPGISGLGIGPGEELRVEAAADAYATDVLLRRDPGELYALRHRIPLGGPQSSPVDGWVERLDPLTLAITASSPRLPAGSWWPGGLAAHANGDIYMVLGRWAHRLSPELEVLASHRLPVERPHNSFVILDGGELVMKDCDAPAGLEPSTFSALDPVTLLPVAPPLRLPEPSVARLSSDGESVVAIGTTRAFRLRLDRDRGRLVADDEWHPAYGPDPDRSFGWDPVISDEHVLWMDNGANSVDRSMVGTGTQPSSLRLWWARCDDGGAICSTEISGLSHGTMSNPPGWDPEGRIVVAYDSGNRVIRGWRLDGDELSPLWRRDDIAHACHLLVYPDTRELVVGDWTDSALLQRRSVRQPLRRTFGLAGRSATLRRASTRLGHDRLVVLDLDSGATKAVVDVPSPVQSFNFPAPGFGRDVYYQSLTTICRVGVVPRS